MKYTKHLERYLIEKLGQHLFSLPSLFSRLLEQIEIQNVFVSLLNIQSIACMQKFGTQLKRETTECGTTYKWTEKAQSWELLNAV